MDDREYIVCAANYYNDGQIRDHKPRNIETGFITCGLRHHNCIDTFAQIVGFPYTEEGHALHRTEVQGFLTSHNRFVKRDEAYAIAFEAGQLAGRTIQKVNKLHSEDLY